MYNIQNNNNLYNNNNNNNYNNKIVLEVSKNFSNNTMIVQFNSLLTDIISNLKNDYGFYIQDDIFKEIINY